MANQEIRTRSGLTPNENRLPYTISTKDVESYLQKKIDTLLNSSADSTKIEIKVYTTEAGKSFLPFVVILPLEALEDRRQSKKQMPSIFDTKSTDSTANLKQPIYKVLSAYCYNKQDGEMFKSDAWRRERHVSGEATSVLLSMRTPKIVSIDGGKDKIIELMIDPIRVFHDMLVNVNDPRNFSVIVDKWQKIQTGEFKYDVYRSINNGKGKKYKSTLADELNRKMRGYRN